MPFIVGPESFINAYDKELSLIPFIDEITYTAAQDSLQLQEVSKLPINDVVRITQVDRYFYGHGPTIIRFYEIVLDDPAEPKVRYVEAKIDSSQRIRILSDLQFRLDKRETKGFLRTLSSAKMKRSNTSQRQI